MGKEQGRSGETPQGERAADGYKPIENYGIIGDLRTVALVGMDGSIDWCCLPRFDSPSMFGALLDHARGGHFKITAVCPGKRKQMYLPESCVLVTRFLNPEGIGEVVDYMTIRKRRLEIHDQQIVRTVRVVSGGVRFRVECFPGFDYARARHEVSFQEGGVVFCAPGECVGLTSPVQLKADGTGVSGEFVLQAGEELTFILRRVAPGGEGRPLVPGYDEKEAFQRAIDFWRRWVGGVKYHGRWREMVYRSAMTLKLLTYEPSGAIVAAPTTSLPEQIGGGRNYDYRYTWIRDAAFTIYAFLRLGLTREAEEFMAWIDKRAHEEARDGSLQIMYGIDGEHRLVEEELKHLEGYKRSSPVRIGNAAYDQLQLDIYGELMDTVYLSNKYSRPISYDLWKHLRVFLDYVCNNWEVKDEGVWEVRGGKKHFVFSKLMCWVALDRGIRLADKRSFPGDRSKWYAVRDEIYETIMAKGWDPERKSFVQHYDTSALDASNLMMPLVFFIAPTDPRMLSTIERTMEELVVDSLVHRYRQGEGVDDGFQGEEGSFSMCTFWLVECLTRAGRLDEARLIFEKMHSYANHVGLYSEEIGRTGELLGNFPQAFTHVSLISAAFNLDRTLSR